MIQIQRIPPIQLIRQTQQIAQIRPIQQPMKRREMKRQIRPQT